jgi:hypothetical protein
VGGPSTATGACAAAGGSVPADPAAVPRARASVCSNACDEGATKVRRRCDEGATTVRRRCHEGTAGRALTHVALGRGRCRARTACCWSWAGVERGGGGGAHLAQHVRRHTAQGHAVLIR